MNRSRGDTSGFGGNGVSFGERKAAALRHNKQGTVGPTTTSPLKDASRRVAKAVSFIALQSPVGCSRWVLFFCAHARPQRDVKSRHPDRGGGAAGVVRATDHLVGVSGESEQHRVAQMKLPLPKVDDWGVIGAAPDAISACFGFRWRYQLVYWSNTHSNTPRMFPARLNSSHGIAGRPDPLGGICRRHRRYPK